MYHLSTSEQSNTCSKYTTQIRLRLSCKQLLEGKTKLTCSVFAKPCVSQLTSRSLSALIQLDVSEGAALPARFNLKSVQAVIELT